MEIDCPFLMFKGKIDGYLVSRPIRVIKTFRDKVKVIDCMNIPVCIKDQTKEAGAICMSLKHINCDVFE